MSKNRTAGLHTENKCKKKKSNKQKKGSLKNLSFKTNCLNYFEMSMPENDQENSYASSETTK